MLEQALGQPVVERVVLATTPGALRIVAYHDVPDTVAFGRQLDHILDRYTPVSGSDVADALRGGMPLPRHAVWITFDDGRRDVVARGLPLLIDRDLPATLFVCPGLIEPGTPYWWTVVAAALARGPLVFEGRTWTDRSLVTHLKTVPDATRRSFTSALDATIGRDDPALDRSLDRGELSVWLAAGMEVGNHTWDHPCLDQCTDDETLAQIRRAHEWLTQLLGRHPRLFAYPNGDHTPRAREVISDLGYEVGLAFDHRLARLRSDPLIMSRLRLGSDVGLPRTRAILSGAHSGAFHLGQRLRRLR